MSEPAVLQDAPPDLTLRPAFAPCATCGQLLLIRVWRQERGWHALPVGVTPVLGTVHQPCRVAGLSQAPGSTNGPRSI
jgi:hypothetical protein